MFPDYFPLDAREYVRDELKLRQKRRLQYSMRAFARDLEISPSFLCEFLAGRQGLSRARAVWIAGKLRLTEEQTDHFWDLLQSEFAPKQELRRTAAFRARHRAKSSASHLQLERFHLIADWYHLLLLEIFSLPNAPQALSEVSAMLNVPEAELDRAVERLCQLGLLRVERAKGLTQYHVLTEATTVGEGVPDHAVQLMHQQTLMFHADAANWKPYSERENLTIAFTLAQEDWPDLRKALLRSVIDTVNSFANNKNEKNQALSLTMQAITLLPSVGSEKK